MTSSVITLPCQRGAPSSTVRQVKGRWAPTACGEDLEGPERRHAVRANLAPGPRQEPTADERTDVPAGAVPSGRGTLPARGRARRRSAAPRSEERRGASAGGLAPHGPARDRPGQDLVRA